jgi:DNA-binding GntR family transcriptional regulator
MRLFKNLCWALNLTICLLPIIFGSMDPKMIAAALRQEIEARALSVGTVLKQEDLAERFDVSRQPVRQALGYLLAEGLLERRSDRSLAVAGLTSEAAREVTAIRCLLEAEALRLSLPNLTDSQLRKAERIAEDLIEETNIATIEELDVAFHALLYGACGNTRLLSLIDGLRREGRRSYATQPMGSRQRADLADQHRALLAACKRRDSAAAVAALLSHLTYSGDVPHDQP